MKSMAGIMASFILPAPRPRLDLRRWCARRAGNAGHQYDHRLPYTLNDFTYATDGFRCLRVRPESGDVEQQKRLIPKVESLSWNHDRLKGWRSLPRLEWLEADDSTCHECDGYGLAGDAVYQECEPCGGTGNEWVGSNYDLSYPVPCPHCKSEGHIAPAGSVPCVACKGKPYGRRPSVVRLDGRYFDAHFYEQVRELGGEFVHDNWMCKPSYPMLKFQFFGGVGLLMGMDPVGVGRRLVKKGGA
jgi:hypothetical protein